MSPYLITSARPARNSRGGRRRQRAEVRNHGAGLMKRPDQVLAARVIHPGLAADGGIDLRQQRRRHLHEIDAALITGRRKPGHVADHAAAECDDAGIAIQPGAHQRVEDLAQHLECLVLLAVGQRRRIARVCLRARGPGARGTAAPTVVLVTTSTSRAATCCAISVASSSRSAADQDGVTALAQVDPQHVWRGCGAHAATAHAGSSAVPSAVIESGDRFGQAKVTQDFLHHGLDLATVRVDDELGDLAGTAARAFRTAGPACRADRRCSAAAGPCCGGCGRVAVPPRFEDTRRVRECAGARGCAASRTAPPPVASTSPSASVRCVDDFRLALAKARFAFAFENVGDVDAGPGLDLVVAVDERQAEPPRQLPAHGALAGPHRAHEEDVHRGSAVLRLERKTAAGCCGRSFSHRTRRASVDVGALAQDLRRHEDQQLVLVVGARLAAEQDTEARYVAEERHFVDRIAALGLEDAAEHDGLAIVDQHLGRDFARVDARHEAARRAWHDLRRRCPSTPSGRG